MMKEETSHCWWFDSHNTSRCSPWLQSTLAELDSKMKAMLKLIEEDADSFAQRAEMYYQKRPELISMVEDFYRAHRSLAERYDLLRSDPAPRVLSTLGSPFSSHRSCQEKLKMVEDQTFDNNSETSEFEEYAESEVEDPEQEDRTHVDEVLSEGKDSELDYGSQVNQEMEDDKVPVEVYNCEVTKLREQIERLKEENKTLKEQLQQKEEEEEERECEVTKLREEIERLKRENKTQKEQLLQKDDEKKEREVTKSREEVERVKRQDKTKKEQLLLKDLAKKDCEVTKSKEEMERLKTENKIWKEQLLQKDEEKREVIRQLGLAVEVLKEENVYLRQCIPKGTPKKPIPFEFTKLKERFLGKLFKGSPKAQPRTVLAL